MPKSKLPIDILFEYYFGNDIPGNEIFLMVTYSHIMSSNYYDISFDRHFLNYRDKLNDVTFAIAHDEHEILIFIDNYAINRKFQIEEKVLLNRIKFLLRQIKINTIYVEASDIKDDGFEFKI